MKKTFIITFFIIILSFVFSGKTLAWDDCPYGLENDKSPGECSRFIDTDHNGICDHSEPAPENRVSSNQTAEPIVNPTDNDTSSSYSLTEESLPELSGKDLKTKTVQEVAGFYEVDEGKFINELDNHLKVNVKPTDTFQLLHDNYGMEPSAVKDLVLNVKNNTPNTIISTTTENGAKKAEKTYYFGIISVLLTAIYLISFILSKLKKISIAAHRKVWNIILLVTFLISGILGLLLTIRIQYGISFQLPFNMLFWHVEAGIAMSLISIFHILWHLPYYAAIIKGLRAKQIVK